MKQRAARRPTWRAAVVNSVRAPGPRPETAVDTAGPVLTFVPMPAPEFPVSTPEKLPLALSPELWEGLSPTQRELFQRADMLLDEFAPESPQSLQDLVSASGDDADDVLSALRLLDTMALVKVQSSDHGPVFLLRATPEEHVRIKGPDNKLRWVFIARPVEPRDVDPSTLN
jgi:hypothetical protein